MQRLAALAAGMASGDAPLGLEPGNNKTGQSGTQFAAVFVWNLPAVSTCPGASAECLRYCYNADERPKFPLERWRQNLAWFRKDPATLTDVILRQISNAPSPAAVRIHSSGDFFSRPYISFWRSIIERTDTTAFWAYTRSWLVASLWTDLESLRRLPNLQLFASWDTTMPPPPPGWRLSIVTMNPEPPPAEREPRLLFCPEQIGRVSHCASCGFCMRPASGGVLFTLH